MDGHKGQNRKNEGKFQYVEYYLENKTYLTQYQVGGLQLQC